MYETAYRLIEKFMPWHDVTELRVMGNNEYLEHPDFAFTLEHSGQLFSVHNNDTGALIHCGIDGQKMLLFWLCTQFKKEMEDYVQSCT